VQAGWEATYGGLIHEGLNNLAKDGSSDAIGMSKKVYDAALADGKDTVAAREWQALALGHLFGVEKCVWPHLMAEYCVVDHEKWIKYEVAPGFLFRARQDLLLESKFDGHLCYVDYKTTSSNKPQWIASWAKSVQLHSSMYALNKSEHLNVQRAVVIGLQKGYKDDNGRQRSIFTYGWVNREFSMSPQYSYEYKRAKGWEAFPVMDEFENYSQWLSGMPQEILTAQFPQTGPIFLREDIAERYFHQQLIREREIVEACERLVQSSSVGDIDELLNVHFKQSFERCEPAYGFKCEFVPICWQPWVEADPLGSGLFRKRQEVDEGAGES
jgi:hypothetical protein